MIGFLRKKYVTVAFVSSFLLMVAAAGVFAFNVNSSKDSNLNTPSQARQEVATSHLGTTLTPTTATTSVNATNTTRAASNPSSVKPKGYVAPVCTKVPIAYTTSYQTVNYLSPGEVKTYGGTDGYRNTCTADSTGWKPSDLVLNPVNKIVYTGVDNTVANQQAAVAAEQKAALAAAARAERIRSCIAYLGAHGAGGSSAEQQCYTIQ